MMMNDIAIANINRILSNEIAEGHAVLGIISVDSEGHIILCWRTDDKERATQWEQDLWRGGKGQIDHGIVHLPEEA